MHIFIFSIKREFELVTSAFTLLELPNRSARYQALQDLWNKVALNGYLVCVFLLAA